MSLAARKATLVNPEGQVPPDWPLEWPFPFREAMPPGYPRKYTGRCQLNAHMVSGELVVNVTDEFDDATDELEGQFLLIEAFQDIDLIRLRQKPDETWSKRALFRINGTGLTQPLEFDTERMKPGADLEVSIKLYAHVGLETKL